MACRVEECCVPVHVDQARATANPYNTRNGQQISLCSVHPLGMCRLLVVHLGICIHLSSVHPKNCSKQLNDIVICVVPFLINVKSSHASYGLFFNLHHHLPTTYQAILPLAKRRPAHLSAATQPCKTC